LHILPSIVELLEKQKHTQRVKTEMVFPAEQNPIKPYNYRTSWLCAVERAGVKDFRFHDLRHTAASYMAMSSATLMELSAFLGHKTLAMVKRYSHVSHCSTASAVNRMNESILKL